MQRTIFEVASTGGRYSTALMKAISMPGMRVNIAQLNRYRRQWEKFAGQAKAPSAKRTMGASAKLAEVTGFGSNPGNLGMFVHIPDGLPPDAPLVVALHGCTQDAADYDRGTGWSTLADRHGFAVLLPEQRRGNNAQLCFNWFSQEDISRDQGEALSIRQMIGHMVAHHGVSAGRVHVTGLSAGGAMTAVMLATYPELFAGGAIIAGLPYGGATGVAAALDSMFNGHPRANAAWAGLVRDAAPAPASWPVVQIWHGTADSTVNTVNAGELVKQWTELHGLADQPDREDRVDGHLHRSWTGRRGELCVEQYVIAGMGHGVPLAAGGVGRPGRFMLESGIDSTTLIATRWGLTGAEMPKREPSTPPAPEPKPATRMPELAGVITAALRKAGLLPRE